MSGQAPILPMTTGNLGGRQSSSKPKSHGGQGLDGGSAGLSSLQASRDRRETTTQQCNHASHLRMASRSLRCMDCSGRQGPSTDKNNGIHVGRHANSVLIAQAPVECRLTGQAPRFQGCKPLLPHMGDLLGLCIFSAYDGGYERSSLSYQSRHGTQEMRKEKERERRAQRPMPQPHF